MAGSGTFFSKAMLDALAEYFKKGPQVCDHYQFGEMWPALGGDRVIFYCGYCGFPEELHKEETKPTCK